MVGMVGQAASWDIGSLIKFLKLGKLRPTMYGKHGVGGGVWAIVELWGEWGIVALGDGVPTNNETINDASRKDTRR